MLQYFPSCTLSLSFFNVRIATTLGTFDKLLQFSSEEYRRKRKYRIKEIGVEASCNGCIRILLMIENRYDFSPRDRQ